MSHDTAKIEHQVGCIKNMSIMCMPALVYLFRYTSCVYQRRHLARL